MLLAYFARRVKLLLLIAGCCAIFSAVFWLYGVPVEPALYAGALCLVLGLGLFVAGYLQERARHRLLRRLEGQIALSQDELPPPRGAIERDYQALVRALAFELRQTRSQADARAADERDYYLRWAHQIKTPLSALRLLLREDDARDGQALAELCKIEQYADMALQYQRLDGGSDLVLRKTALDPLVRAVLRRYARLFILKRLSVQFEETGLRVLTDEKWLELAIGQVVSNAIKYTPAGVIRIYADGEVLVIADPGIGIRPEDLPRVCERGFTGYNGREEKKSTGIGLYLCSRALSLCGHGLRIESAPGEGTSVRIDLRRHRGMLE